MGCSPGRGADGRRSHKPIGAGAFPFMPLRGFPDRSLDFVARQNAGELWLGFGVPLIENLSQAGEVEQQRLLSRGFGCENSLKFVKHDELSIELTNMVKKRIP